MNPDIELEKAYDAAQDAAKAMRGVHVTTPEGVELLKRYREAHAELDRALRAWREARREPLEHAA